MYIQESASKSNFLYQIFRDIIYQILQPFPPPGEPSIQIGSVKASCKTTL